MLCRIAPSAEWKWVFLGVCIASGGEFINAMKKHRRMHQTHRSGGSGDSTAVLTISHNPSPQDPEYIVASVARGGAKRWVHPTRMAPYGNKDLARHFGLIVRQYKTSWQRSWSWELKIDDPDDAGDADLEDGCKPMRR